MNNLKSGCYFTYSSVKFSSSSDVTVLNVHFFELDTNDTFSSTNLLKFYFKIKNDETLIVNVNFLYNENITSLFRSKCIYILSFFISSCQYYIQIIN